jgi:hypothetical protein
MEERIELGFRALEDALLRALAFEFEERFAPLAESLLWVVILNDSFWDENESVYRKERDSDEAGRTIEGMRYARHRLVHDIRVYGMHGALDAVVGGESKWGQAVWGSKSAWVWRSLDGLDEAKKRAGEDIYVDHLQGRPVMDTIRSVQAFLEGYREGRSP